MNLVTHEALLFGFHRRAPTKDNDMITHIAMRVKDMWFLMDNKNENRLKFGTTKVPETYVFNQQSIVIKRFVGPQDWDNPFFDSFFQDLK